MTDLNWRLVASQAGADPVLTWVRVREQWPYNDVSARPDTPSAMDALWSDHDRRQPIVDAIAHVAAATAADLVEAG